MLVCKCDRCGSIYETNENQDKFNGICFATRKEDNEIEVFENENFVDLCSDCVDNLLMFLGARPPIKEEPETVLTKEKFRIPESKETYGFFIEPENRGNKND